MQPAKHRRQSGSGFTLVELLVVIALIAILAALLFPVFSGIREKGWQTACLSNLRQISRAVLIYAEDYDETLPRDVTRWGNLPAADPCSTWNPLRRIETKLRPYIRNTGVFTCPNARTPQVIWDDALGRCARAGWGYPSYHCFPYDATRGKPLSYGWNVAIFQLRETSLNGGCDAPGKSLFAVDSPESKVMVADSRHSFLSAFELSFANYPGASAFYASNVKTYWPEFAGGTGPEIVPERDARHQMGQNAAFFDGSARWLQYEQLTGRAFVTKAENWFGN